MNTILNLTQHQASEEQTSMGVYDIVGDEHVNLLALLTFTTLPSHWDMIQRANALVGLINRLDTPAHTTIMIGGAPFFMSNLEYARIDAGFLPVYAFSTRVAAEVNGVKTSVFKHLGFVEVSPR